MYVREGLSLPHALHQNDKRQTTNDKRHTIHDNQKERYNMPQPQVSIQPTPIIYPDKCPDDLSPSETIEVSLDLLARLRARKEDMIASSRLAKVQIALAAALSELTVDVDRQISLLEKEIKKSIVDLGESVTATDLQAVYVSGRITWDTKSMLGYEVAHPEIGAFKKVGKPSVRIQNRRKK
jgi:hypothetical protein